MSTKLITYDLRSPHKDYSKLYAAIERLDASRWHCLESVWILNVSYTVIQIRDYLNQYIDSNDQLTVFELSGNWASAGLPDQCNNWLNNNLT